MVCAQGTNIAPAIKFCFDSGQVILGLVAIVIFGLCCMAVGAGMRKK